MFLRKRIMKYTTDYSAEIARLKNEIKAAYAVVIGAGAGLSTAAGFTYNTDQQHLKHKQKSDIMEK